MLITAGLALAEEASIFYPADYATPFTNYLSLDRVQNDDQIIRLFAKDIAMNGAHEGQSVPEGPILVGDVYAAKKDVDGNNALRSKGGTERACARCV